MNIKGNFICIKHLCKTSKNLSTINIQKHFSFCDNTIHIIKKLKKFYTSKKKEEKINNSLSIKNIQSRRLQHEQESNLALLAQKSTSS